MDSGTPQKSSPSLLLFEALQDQLSISSLVEAYVAEVKVSELYQLRRQDSARPPRPICPTGARSNYAVTPMPTLHRKINCNPFLCNYITSFSGLEDLRIEHNVLLKRFLLRYSLR